MKFGFIPTEGGHLAREALAEVDRAEALGLDSVWMEEQRRGGAVAERLITAAAGTDQSCEGSAPSLRERAGAPGPTCRSRALRGD